MTRGGRSFVPKMVFFFFFNHNEKNRPARNYTDSLGVILALFKNNLTIAGRIMNNLRSASGEYLRMSWVNNNLYKEEKANVVIFYPFPYLGPDY